MGTSASREGTIRLWTMLTHCLIAKSASSLWEKKDLAVLPDLQHVRAAAGGQVGARQVVWPEGKSGWICSLGTWPSQWLKAVAYRSKKGKKVLNQLNLRERLQRPLGGGLQQSETEKAKC